MSNFVGTISEVHNNSVLDTNAIIIINASEERSVETITEVWESARISHLQDFENLPPRRYDAMNAPHVNVSLSDGLVEVNIYDAVPSRRLTLNVPRNTDINSLKREIFRRSRTSIPRDSDNFEIEFCDYEFFLHLSNGIVLNGSTVLGDLLSDPQLNVIDLKYSPHGGVFGSIRTLIPGSVEQEEKREFLQLIEALNSSPSTYDMIVLSLGACTPEQIVPKFAHEACQNGKIVLIIAINPGFYHGTYSFSDNLYGYQRSSEEHTHLLAYWFEHPESDNTSTFHNFDSWQKIGERGDKFHGDFLLKDNRNIHTGALQLNCFAMCWPGVARNRILDSDILSSITKLIVRCSHSNCYFVPIFTTGLNENEIHAEQFRSWVVEVEENHRLPTDYIVPVIDIYQRHTGFIVCKCVELAAHYWSKLQGTLPHNDIVARLLPDFEPDNLAALGGKLFSTLSEISFNDIVDY